MIDDQKRYWDERWLVQNQRIKNHQQAAQLIVAKYSARDWKHGRQTAVCAASCNSPLWQEAVERAYPKANI